eukprot:GHVS01035855.1.p1 GENE.GHVS01035855.1~~GHVS01035855.1.p1  ORF type:complete len:437 (+),score=78.45 GHVS01035855.1:95-1405(+)
MMSVTSSLIRDPATLASVAACTLNQWAMDFDGNLERTIVSLQRAKAEGAKLRVGPELELCGYGCEDHFLEADTITHCWESVHRILEHPDKLTDGMLVDLGMPVMYRSVIYNCRVFCLNGRVILIRPKMYLADSGNYREARWFGKWTDPRDVISPLSIIPCGQPYSSSSSCTPAPPYSSSSSSSVSSSSSASSSSQSPSGRVCSSSSSSSSLPSAALSTAAVTPCPPPSFPVHPLLYPFHLPPCCCLGSHAPAVVPIGVAAIDCCNTTIASETCEELWTPSSPHVEMSLDGVEIFLNGSGSHHELRKLRTRLDLIQSATFKCGGAYVYSNMRGCDGGRVYFDGNALVAVNGDVVGQASGFGMEDVEVITRVVDLETIRSYRASSASRSTQSPSFRQSRRRSLLGRPAGCGTTFGAQTRTASSYHCQAARTAARSRQS